MDIDNSSESTASSSQPTSPATAIKPIQTRFSSSATYSRSVEPDPEKIASLAQKLYETLKGLKSSKNKNSVTIPLQEFESIVTRCQQIAQLTSTFSSSRRASDEATAALSLQITDLSDKISGRLIRLEERLDPELHKNPPIETPPPSSNLPASVLGGTRHPTLYLADGNLVMAAPDTTTGGDMLFRVHQSMLSLQSPVFASMFTLPHPHDNRDMYDGTPFVRMPDEAQDIESLLKVLYNPSELPYKRLDPMTPILVRRTLAMATKYEMDTLRTRIVTQIEADWPSTLAEWDRLETEIGSLAIFDDDGVCLDRRLPEPGAAISLAMDYRITKILPAAFYHLSRLSTTADWDADPNGLDEDARTARWSFLHATELKLLLKVRETIANFEQLAMPAPSKSCSTNAACDYAWEVAHLRWISAKDPLYAMQEFVESRPLGGPCKYCWATGKEPIRKHRGELWDEIYDCIQEHCP